MHSNEYNLKMGVISFFHFIIKDSTVFVLAAEVLHKHLYHTPGKAAVSNRFYFFLSVHQVL